MLKIFDAWPAVSEEDVCALESRLKLNLPPQYRNFLLATNGGRPELDIYQVPSLAEDPTPRLHYLFHINAGDDAYNIEWNRQIFSDRLAPDFLVIGTTEGSDVVCISTKTGAVFHWDDYKQRLHDVAPSFSDFVNTLTSEHESDGSDIISGSPAE